ncbi:MAG: sterol desaturase family protein [Chitinivibrionales bacterium]|nr:sterol desaturase family protein [Chitinivibrionales bacterium]
MNIDADLLIQIIIFFTAIFVFTLLERFRPGFSINKKQDLLLNVFSLLIVIFAGEYLKALVSAGYKAVNLSALLSGNPFPDFPGPAKIVLAVLLTDCSLYWVHRAMHTKFLWRTHKYHHSIGQIWWLSGSRTSLVHLFLFAIPQIFIGYYLLRLTSAQALVPVCFGIVVNLWIHTNIWVNLGPLNRLLITPNYHRIHHGARGLGNKNLGFVLTIWDRMFGTYLDTQTTGKDFKLFPVPTKERLLAMILGI